MRGAAPRAPGRGGGYPHLQKRASVADHPSARCALPVKVICHLQTWFDAERMQVQTNVTKGAKRAVACKGTVSRPLGNGLAGLAYDAGAVGLARNDNDLVVGQRPCQVLSIAPRRS